MPLKQKLTPKQALFIKWYVSAQCPGNGTESARRAGYKGNDLTLAQVAAENIRKPHIKAEIDKRMAKASKGADVTIESILRNLSALYEEARDLEQLSVAFQCLQAQGKHLKMFVDRIEHVEVMDDMTQEQLVGVLKEVLEEGSIDISQLLATDGADNSSGIDLTGTQKTH